MLGHIVMDVIDNFYLYDNDPLTYDKAMNDSNSKK